MADTPRRLPLADALAGLAVAGLVLPEGVAYAGIAGLAPGQALIAAIAGGLIYVLLGRSRFAVIAPTSSSAAILAAAVASLGADPALRLAEASMLVALVGVIFVALALFRLGSLSGFIARPVLRGFAFGLAATIIIRQLPRLAGVKVAGHSVFALLWGLAQAVGAINPASLALGLGALAALVALRQLPRMPGAVLVIVAGIALGGSGWLTPLRVDLAGPIALAMPHWALPPLALLPRLTQLAAPIALILFAESWGTMRSFALAHGDTLDANRELAALGAANLGAALLQGLPVGAGFSASAANAAAGAQSRLAQASAALALLALGLLATRWIALIPEPVLAAVVIAALTHALDPAPIRRLFHLRRDQWVALAAAAGVLVLGVLDGMLAAIALSIATLLYDLAHPSISELGRLGDSHDYVDLARHSAARRVTGMAIFRPNAPLFFANAEPTLAQIAARGRDAPRLVLSLEQSADLDASAVEALGEFAALVARRGQQLTLARAHDAVRLVLRRAGLSHLAASATFSVADAAALAGLDWRDAAV